jgi:hypothetical protein
LLHARFGTRFWIGLFCQKKLCGFFLKVFGRGWLIWFVLWLQLLLGGGIGGDAIDAPIVIVDLRGLLGSMSPEVFQEALDQEGFNLRFGYLVMK